MNNVKEFDRDPNDLASVEDSLEELEHHLKEYYEQLGERCASRSDKKATRRCIQSFVITDCDWHDLIIVWLLPDQLRSPIRQEEDGEVHSDLFDRRLMIITDGSSGHCLISRLMNARLRMAAVGL